MMDYDKLIEQLNAWNEQHLSVVCGSKHFACDYLCENEDCIVVRAATALSTLQDENESLKEKLYDGEGVNLVDYWMQQAKIEENGHRNCQAENEKLRAELESVRAERNAAQSLLAERIGVRGAESITTAFGLPIDRLRELAEADREGKIPKYTIGDTIYDRFGDAWEVTAVERLLLAGEPKWIYRCGHIGTNDYFALWEFEVLTRAEAEAALRREQDD